MRCPVCKEELKRVSVGVIEIDFCQSGCKGVWFDHKELESLDEPQEGSGDILLEILGATRDAEAQRRVVDCPKCDVRMRRHAFSYNTPIIVDECPQCHGVWLDGGELGIIRDNFYGVADRKEAIQRMVEIESTEREFEDFHRREMERFAEQREFGNKLMKIFTLGLVRR
jgi:Zn-finger nucleic acid-binding protein